MPSSELSRERCAHCGTDLAPGATSCSSCGRAVTQAAPTPSPVTGHLLQGKWRLDRKLGQGGMGSVYLAHERDLDRQVAIKLLSDTLCDDAELVQRFEREARMMARLDHPNLVPVYAVGREGRVPFIVMKSLSGASLAHHLKERGRLPLREVISIGRQLCAGLQFIHDHGVVHRDVKPGNVFVAPDGHVTLLDLGVARDAGSALTRSGVLIGTPRYMAPEQIAAQQCDHRADLYALATVIYEMVVGKTVFPSDSDFSVMRAHVDQRPPDLSNVEGVPGPLAAAIKRGLEKLPIERFQSAREFSDALDAVGRLPEIASLPDPPMKAAPLVVPPSAPLSVLAPGGTLADDALPPTAPSRGREVRRGMWLVAAAIALGLIAGVVGAARWSGASRDAEPTVVPMPPPKSDPVVIAAKSDPAPVEAPPVKPEPVAVVAPPEDPKPKVPGVPVKRGPAEVRIVTTTGDGEASWAYVDVDGLRKGTTPLTVKLPPGEHELVFRRQGFANQTRKVTVVAGETKRLAVELAP